jgi:hypothetical protein
LYRAKINRRPKPTLGIKFKYKQFTLFYAAHYITLFLVISLDGVKVLPPTLAQSADIKYPIYIPTIPRILDALLDQARYRVTYAENFPGKLGNRPKYHLQTFVRYLHLEKPQQRERLLPELAERNRGEMEEIINKFKRKPLVTLASLQHKELDKPVR